MLACCCMRSDWWNGYVRENYTQSGKLITDSPYANFSRALPPIWSHTVYALFGYNAIWCYTAWLCHFYKVSFITVIARKKSYMYFSHVNVCLSYRSLHHGGSLKPHGLNCLEHVDHSFSLQTLDHHTDTTEYACTTDTTTIET